jgi:hypothetical protein
MVDVTEPTQYSDDERTAIGRSRETQDVIRLTKQDLSSDTRTRVSMLGSFFYAPVQSQDRR